MRFALPKNRTALFVVFAILGIIVSLTLGLYHINQMAQYSNESHYKEYRNRAKNAAAMLKQEITNNYQSLQTSAKYIATADSLDKESIMQFFEILNADMKYVDMAILDRRGIGYNTAGEAVDLSSEEYVINAISGESSALDRLIYTEDNKPVMVYAVPIEKDGNFLGVLTVTQQAEINNVMLLNHEIEEGRYIYVINKYNDPVAYIKGMDINDYNYERMSSQGRIIEDSTDFNVGVQQNMMLLKQKEPDLLIWNRVPVGINDWYVLAGSKYNIEPATREMLNSTKLMWFVITTSTLLMFVLMITTQFRSNRRIVKTLYLDPVTGGDNWYKFRMNVNKILTSKQFSKKSYALINFDINRFKIINDAYGYQKGDEVLKDIYNAIKRWSRYGEPFTRYAADQFYILMSFSEQDELIHRITDLDERIRQLRYTKAARIFYGVYFITEITDSVDRMGEFAQVAKNNIKGSSEGTISFFDDAARRRLLEEEEIERSMNEALKNEEFLVYLQPKYMAKEEVISGAEALVRWQSNNGMPFSPGDFIPLFEKNGFITELDYYMLKKVCQLIRDWLDKGYRPLPISVNISRLHFANVHLAEIITDIVDSYEVPHNLIELELTESAFLQNKQMLIDTVVRLRDYGFLVSMDDFGAGYSSLNSLKDLPLDTVKLDGELFRMTDEVERGLCVIRNTITMAKDLHMKVVAECIETREQVEFLCSVGCDVIQGYYFAKPMPADQFEEKYYSFQAID